MCGSTVEGEQLLVDIDSVANRIIVKRIHLFNQLDRGRKSTANGKASLQVEGIGEVGKWRDVKFWPAALTDLITVSKLKAIGFKISFGDEKGPVVICRQATNEICFV